MAKGRSSPIAGTLAIACALWAFTVREAGAALIPFDLQGKGGAGLLPTNENETGADTSGSLASGGEVGTGITFDTDTNILNLDFAFGDDSTLGSLGFGDLSAPLREEAAGGIHIHGPASFLENASIVFFLNNGTEPGVTTTISADELAGRVTGFVTLTDLQETTLFAGQYYINVHSDLFPGGEIRGNLVPVPEPATGILFAVGAAGVTLFRRRQATSGEIRS